MRHVRWIATVILAVTMTGQTAQGQACPADLNASCVVDGVDLALLLGAWSGAAVYAPCPPIKPADLNGDCRVNGLDLAVLLGAWGPCICATQLAGNPLPVYPAVPAIAGTIYPFFEYVRAFNQGARLAVAIDPTRYPQIAGKTCRVYIVEHKTPAQWTANPALADVTAAGFQVNLFAAGTIQNNTIEIDPNPPGPAHGLSGQATETGVGQVPGSGLGHGYDVVFDCNQNGSLGIGDYIDGYSATEAGMYVVHNTAAAGPYVPVHPAVYTVTAGSVTAGFEGEDLFYPTGIAALGQLPLVIVSHGNGHNYQWYSHIGNHLASYGYIVMSHQCNTVPGIGSAATTTFQHTNAIIAQQATIAAGVLNGHIDTTRIIWIGHSRGAEGITIAYDRLFDGMPLTFNPGPVGWTINSIRLLSSIAPTVFLDSAESHPHTANYHLWTSPADADVDGCAVSNIGQTFQLFHRAGAFRQSISVYGAGHGDFHNGTGSSVVDGPCTITRAKTHAIMRGYLLPLVKRYVNNNIPAKDFLWRQWERFKPIGAPAEAACAAPNGTGVDVVVNLMYQDSSTAGNFVIDSYQANPAAALASSGATVASTVANLTEGREDDNNQTFVTAGGDPMNGMTAASQFDSSSGVVFDWAAATNYEFTMLAPQRDFSKFVYLSFRACQGTRHNNTVPVAAGGTGALEDLTFRVVLEDGATPPHTSAINITAYGGGIEEPYQRNHLFNDVDDAGTALSCDCGGIVAAPAPANFACEVPQGAAGAGTRRGWANEFETIRIRLTDFLNNGSLLNLTDIRKMRLEFAAAAAPGVPAGSAVGRLGLDDVELTTD